MQERSEEMSLILREQEMLDAEKLNFEELFEQAPVGCAFLGPDGQIRQINPAGAALFEKTQTEIIGLWFGAFVTEADQMTFNIFLQKIFQNSEPEHCEIAIADPVNQLMFLQIKGMALADRQECRLMFTDVTERRIVQDSLMFSEAKYRALFENLSVAFSYHRVLLDGATQVEDSVIMEANSMYASMLGQPLSGLINRKKSEVGLFSLNNDFDWKSLYQRGISAGQPMTFEYYSESLQRWFLITAFVPSLHHLAFIYLDTTETKKQKQILIDSEKDIVRWCGKPMRLL